MINKSRIVSAVVVVCLLGGCCLVGCGGAKELTKTVGNKVVINDYEKTSLNDLHSFSYKLFENNMDEHNPVMSPVSAYLALAMAAEGAEGDTKVSFNNLFGNEITAVADDLMNKLPDKSKEFELSLANSAWIDDQYDVNSDWLIKLKSCYDAQAFQTDLQDEAIVDNVNSWVEKKTNKLIKRMIDDPFMEEDVLVLFNTIYFDAKWQNKFSRSLMDEFKLSADEYCDAELMTNFGYHYEYMENEVARGIIMPYRNENGKKYAMVSLLPKNDMSVREMYSKLISENEMARLIDNRELKMVNLKYPKFEIEFEKVLNESLMNMGLDIAFDSQKADFTAMGQPKNGRNTFISLVLQKAKIQVDKDGTKAAAVTEVVVTTESCALQEEEPIEVFFDEPFLYMIMDIDEQIPLFIGVLDNPNQ